MSETSRLWSRAVVLGGAGEFGSLMAELLGPRCDEVIRVDREVELSSEGPQTFAGDATEPSQRLAEALSEAELAISAVPGSLVPASVRALAPLLPQESLLVDVASVKKPVVEAMESAAGGCELLSIHPMFRASVGFEGSNVAVVPTSRTGSRSDVFCDWLRSVGAKLTELSAEDHDKLMACSQAATHAAILTYGLALRSMGYDIAAGLRSATPPHRIMLGLIARIAGGAEEVYFKIQRENELAGDARAAIAGAAERLQQALEDSAGSEAAFGALVEEVRAVLGDEAPRLQEYVADLFAVSLPPAE